MSVAIGLAPNISLLLWPWALYALLLSLSVAALAGVWLAWSRRRVAAVALATSLLGGAAVLALSVAVPSRSYAYVLGGYQASPTSGRQQALADRWHGTHEEITALDWLILARQWGVCHGLWAQSACTLARSEEPQGIARAMITDAARGGPVQARP
jgi:hypothetical protein